MVLNDYMSDFKQLRSQTDDMKSTKNVCEALGVSRQYISKVIHKSNAQIVSESYIKLLETLGYDVVVKYVPKDNKREDYNLS